MVLPHTGPCMLQYWPAKTRYAYWYSIGTNIFWLLSIFWLDLKPAPQEKKKKTFLAWYYNLSQKPMAGEDMALGDSLPLLQCYLVMPSNYLLNIYAYTLTHELLPALVGKASFRTGQQLMERSVSGQDAEDKRWELSPKWDTNINLIITKTRGTWRKTRQKELKSQRAAMKYCYLDMTRLPQSRTQNSCAYLYRTSTRSKQAQNFSMWLSQGWRAAARE